MAYKNAEDGLEWRRNHRAKLKILISEYLKTHPCVKCGFSDIRALEFDHLDVMTKKRNISEMSGGTPNIATLFKEIEKCQVLCANCHRIKTLEEKDYLTRRVVEK